jgi:hypothetical protein
MTTYKQKFNKKHGQPINQSNSLQDIARLSGYKLSGIKTIFNKGKGAYKSNPQSVRPNVKSPEQWAYARVYASVDPSSKAYKIDKSHLVKTSSKPTRKLTEAQMDKLKQHKVHHTKKHMDLMKTLMRQGKSFSASHKEAMSKVGK